tara:strand:- start:6745 stop:6900 length:156 start_codon:yes stop_codon:yes gene_type:complete
MHNRIDKIKYIKAVNIFLLLINSIISMEKAENVVNDPKKPIIKKNLIKFSL